MTKLHLRVIGIDDGPFTRRHHYAVVVAVACTLPGSIDGLLATRVRIDGTDGTDRVIELLQASPYLAGARAILVDGISVGGFNVLDLARLNRRLKIPVVSVTRRSPDLPAMRSAIRTYFPRDARRRILLVNRHPPVRASMGGGSLWISVCGGTRAHAAELVRRTIRVGRWPEPLRIARLVARTVSKASSPASALNRKAA